MVEWNFPGNGNGQIRGYSDAGIEAFSENGLQSLARENCQNSLDAYIDNGKPVHIEFEQILIDSEEIPGYNSYKKIIEKCRTYWKEQKSEKANRFLKIAGEEIRKRKTFVLRISDYNTTGLLEPYGDSFGGWNSLTKLDGGATKDGDSAGSFGVGKNASFSNSYYRLVFYRTLNVNMECAAQGMSRLFSFPTDISNPIDTMTTGIGYYGNTNRNTPVNKIDGLDKIKKRNDVGTDVFIYGFNGVDWENEIIKEILESFLMSIHRNQLEVTIQGTHINKDSLYGVIKRYSYIAKDAYCNYRVISEPNKVINFEKDFHYMGTLKMRVLIDHSSKLNQKVLVVRKSGMKLFQMGGISKIIPFTAILELEGTKLNEYFREMETIKHDKWVPKKHSNPKQAKEYCEELKDWVRKNIMDLGEGTSDEEVEVEGLSGVLQDEEVVYENQESDDKKENLNNHLGVINIMERVKQVIPKGKFYPIGEDGLPKSKNTKDVKGDISSGGKSYATRTLKGVRKRITKEKHLGTPNTGGNEIVHKENGISTPCSLESIRIMKLEELKYRIIFEVPRNVKEGNIEIVAVGENGKSNKLIISDAIVISGCTWVNVNSGIIRFKNIKGGEKVKIDFSLINTKDYAMEVGVYEYN